MKTRWMNRRNEVTGENERFYPITHTDAIVGLGSWVETESFEMVDGEEPTMSPVVANKFAEIEERLANMESEIEASVARLSNI